MFSAEGWADVGEPRNRIRMLWEKEGRCVSFFARKNLGRGENGCDFFELMLCVWEGVVLCGVGLGLLNLHHT